MTLYLFGSNNSIIQKYLTISELTCKIAKIPKGDTRYSSNYTWTKEADNDSLLRVVYSSSLLIGKRAYDLSDDECELVTRINMIYPLRILSALNAQSQPYQFVYVSSESAQKGSFDEIYAATKAAVESVVLEKIKNHPKTQIIAIAPSKIEDSRMTQSRSDLEQVLVQSSREPLGRLIQSVEVANILKMILENPQPSLSNIVIPINGGKFARSK